MADRGEALSVLPGARSRIWFSRDRERSDLELPSACWEEDEVMKRALLRPAEREIFCRHTDGSVFAKAFIEKELMA
jgi:hypothetical protein